MGLSYHSHLTENKNLIQMITLTKVGSNVKYEGIEGLDTTSVGIYQEREITIDGENVALSHGRVKVNTVLSNLEIGGTTPTTEAEFWTAVEAVFPNPAGSGSSTPSTIILAAPDDSQWILGVNDSGALTTTELATPVAGAALTSITLTSADGTEWEVTVTNAGALTTTAV
jgi:hypothetical protein